MKLCSKKTVLSASIGLLVATATPILAEHPSCAFSPELRQTLLELEPENSACGADTACWRAGEQRASALLEAHPGQIWVARVAQRYQERLAFLGGSRAELLESARLAAEAAPKDAVAQYLWGRLQASSEEPFGLTRALVLEERLPLARVALLYSAFSRKSGEEEHAREWIQDFVADCPARDFEVVQLVESWPDAPFWLPLIDKMRGGLAQRPPLERVVALSLIWQAEFKLRPPEEHAAARAKVAAELLEIEKLPLEAQPIFWATLNEGSEIAGRDPEIMLQRKAAFFPCEGDVTEAAKKDLKAKLGLPTNPYEASTPNEEQVRGLIAGYGSMVERCPKDAILRFEYASALSSDTHTSDDQLLAAAQAASAALVASRGSIISPRPLSLNLVQFLVDRKLAPATALGILEEARKDFDLFLNRQKSRSRANANPEMEKRFERAISATEAWIAALEARLRVQLGELDKAGAQLEVAHALFVGGGQESASAQIVRQFSAARSELQAANPKAKLPPELVLGAPGVDGELDWKSVALDFGGFPLQDPAGKTWQKVDLAGKTWLVNLWATWCGPCMVELPHIQKLYEELKGRQDVGVLTLNFDTDLGKVGPFLERKGYTFPVLLASQELFGHTKEGIPQNWLLDAKTQIRRKATGFDPKNPEKFLEQVKTGLEELKVK